MGSPYHVSHLLACDKASYEFQALALIAQGLAHPDRTLLSAFVQGAEDREAAGRFLLDDVGGRDKARMEGFLGDWMRLVRRVRPTACGDLDPVTLLGESVWRRDGGRCCISKVDEKNVVPVHILSRAIFRDGDMARGGRLDSMLAVYIGRSRLESLRALLDQDLDFAGCDASNRLMLLSPQMLEHFANGRVSLMASTMETTINSAHYYVCTNGFIPSVRVDTAPWITLDNRATDISSLPNPLLVGVHHQLAPAIAWLEAFDYMKQSYRSTSQGRSSLTGKGSWIRWSIQSAYPILQRLWLQTPISIRASVYKCLASLGQRIYGGTGSDSMHRLPFNLYLRKAQQDWAPQHQAELRALQLVQKYTRIPAPKGIDAIHHGGSSYLLMTAVHGCGIGLKLHTMTDTQLDLAAQDLAAYIAELRHIPNTTGLQFCICNPLGGGILDWRIGDSQREQLRFRTEAEFNQFLTYDLPFDDDERMKISKAHSVKHDIVFTHADLNLRNILVDEMGRISGIVDWECAGWYPEYWEYTKMHFTARVTPRWIADVVDQIFPGYRDELVVEDMLAAKAPSW